MSKRNADEIEEDVDEFQDGDARKYFKEGQKFVTPINGDSTRGFYESLLEEKPESHLAIRYCVENGLFAADKHQALLKKYTALKASGIFNHNRIALERMAAKTGEKLESTPIKPRQVKRELTDASSAEPKAKKHKKDKKDKKDKKEKKDKSDEVFSWV